MKAATAITTTAYAALLLTQVAAGQLIKLVSQACKAAAKAHADDAASNAVGIAHAGEAPCLALVPRPGGATWRAAGPISMQLQCLRGGGGMGGGCIGEGVQQGDAPMRGLA